MTERNEGDCFRRTFVDQASRLLVGKLRSGEPKLVHADLDGEHGTRPEPHESNDAYYAIFQMRGYSRSHERAIGARAPLVAEPARGSVYLASLTDYQAFLDGAFDSLNMVMSRTYLEALAEEVGAVAIALRADRGDRTARDPVLSRLEPMLLEALADPSSVGTLFVDHIVTATALHVAERYGVMRRAMVRSGMLAPWQEKRARELIAGNLTKELSLAEIAAECRLSVAYFSRAFKSSFGMAPHAWLQEHRIQRSKVLLRRASLPLAEIAAQCGFADQSHFSRVFKRAVGVPPGEWRRLMLE